MAVIEHNYDFPKTWWQWLITGIGLILAVTPLFWLIQAFSYYSKPNKIKFFDERFYKVSFNFSIFFIIILIISFIPV